MTWTLAVELTKPLQIVERDRRRTEPLIFLVDRFDTGQVQHRIEQGRGVAGGQHKAVAVRPDWILGIEAQEILPQRVDDRSHRHRCPRMAGFCRLNRIDAQRADGVYRDLVDRAARRHHAVPLIFEPVPLGDRADERRTPAMRSAISSIGRSILIMIGCSSGPGGSRVAN